MLPLKFIFIISILSLLFFTFVNDVYAWSVKAHVYSSNLVLDDATDCKVTIPGTTADGIPFGEFDIEQEICDAINQNAPAYRLGAIYGDALPDLIVGPGVLHTGELSLDDESERNLTIENPYPNKWTANDYQKYLFRKLYSNPTNRAYLYGTLVHTSGDTFGHTWINDMTGGAWDWGEIDVVIGHIAIENYVNYRVPDLQSEQLQLDQSQGLAKSIARSMITDPEIESHTDYFHNDVFRKLKQASEDAYKKFKKERKKAAIDFGISIALALTGIGGWGGVAQDGLELALKSIATHEAKAWRRDVREGIDEWPGAGQKAAVEMLHGDLLKIPSHYKDWALDNAGMIPGGRAVVWFVKAIDSLTEKLEKIGEKLSINLEIKPLKKFVQRVEKKLMDKLEDAVCDFVEEETEFTCDEWLRLYKIPTAEGWLVLRYPPGYSCEDGLDNGGDGKIDGDDEPDCDTHRLVKTFEFGGIELPQLYALEDLGKALGSCSDGIDNGGDGVADDQDEDCIEDRYAGNRIGVLFGSCNDGIDNGHDPDPSTKDNFDVNCVEDERMDSVGDDEFKGIRDITELLDKQMHLDSNQKFTVVPDDNSIPQFAPFFNSVTLSKLTLLSSSELNRLLSLAGVPDTLDTSIESCRGEFPLIGEIIGNGPGCRYPEPSSPIETNVLFDTAKTLDGDYQWRRENPKGEIWSVGGFRLYENCESRYKVFYRVFLDVPKGTDSDNDGIDDDCDPDMDNDFVSDDIDNCPTIKNGPNEVAIPGIGNQSDNDQDGLGDACDPDDDNDNLPDTREDVNQNGIVDLGETDPFDPDTDGDGFRDDEEVDAESDATNPLSVPEGRPFGNCNDLVDNDLDNLTDLSDPACLSDTIFTISSGPSVIPLGPIHPASLYTVNLSPRVSSSPNLVISCPQLGLTSDGCDDGTDGDRDVISGLSLGNDFKPFGIKEMKFSVAQSSDGFSGTAVDKEADCSEPEAGADEFRTNFDGLNYQVADENGISCSDNNGYTLSLQKSDEIRSLDKERPFILDQDKDGRPDVPVYFTLELNSPSLNNVPLGVDVNSIIADEVVTGVIAVEGPDGNLKPENMISGLEQSIATKTGFTNAKPNDVLRFNRNFLPAFGIYASSQQLGLVDGDKIDGLCLLENGDGEYHRDIVDQIDIMAFSLAPESPSLISLGALPGDVLIPGMPATTTNPSVPPRVLLQSSTIGITPSSNIDAMICEFQLFVNSTPTEGISLVNQEYTVNTKVSLDEIELPNLTVKFRIVSGPCEGYFDEAVTDVNGIAKLNYSCHSQGVDIIESCVEFHGSSVCDYVEKQWVDETPSYTIEYNPSSSLRSADILQIDLTNPDGPPVTAITCENLGLSSVSCQNGNDIDGFSYGDDRKTKFGPLEFSLRSMDRGFPGSSVDYEAQCNPNETHGDAFTTESPLSNRQVFDENGNGCSTYTGPRAIIPISSQPLSLASSESGTFYITRTDNQVSILDGRNNILSEVPVGLYPVDVAINERDQKLYVLNQGDSSISVIDMKTNTLITSMLLYSTSILKGIAVEPQIDQVMVTSENELIIVDGNTMTITKTIPFSNTLGNIAINPVSRLAYVENSNAILVVDTRTNKVINSIYLGFDPNSITTSTRNNLVFVTDEFGNSLTVIQGSTGQILQTVPVGLGPSGVTVDDKLNRAYIANTIGNSITVLDLSSYLTIATLNSFTGPFTVGVNPISHMVYSVNKYTNDIWTIKPFPENIGATLQISNQNLNGIVEQPPQFVDDDNDGIPNKRVYFTLTSSSPALSDIICPGPDGIFDTEDDRQATPSDILASINGEVSCWAPYEETKLKNVDNIDGLCLEEDGDGVYKLVDDDNDGVFDEDPDDGIDNDLDGSIDEDPFDDRLIFSLRNDSPSLLELFTDDDFDGLVDEDPVNGIDDDGDFLVDEDPIGTSGATLLIPRPLRVLDVYGTKQVAGLYGLVGESDIDAMKCQFPLVGGGGTISIETEPEFDENQVCQMHVINFRVRYGDNLGNSAPAPNLPIALHVVDGPNKNLNDISLSNTNGDGVFSYQGTNPGTDIIFVAPQLVGWPTHNQIIKTWFPTDPLPENLEDEVDVCPVDPFGDDNDNGIDNEIDGVYSNGAFVPGGESSLDFTNQHLGRGTFGKIDFPFNGVGFAVFSIPGENGLAVVGGGNQATNSVNYCDSSRLSVDALDDTRIGAIISCIGGKSITRQIFGTSTLQLDSMNGVLSPDNEVEATKLADRVYFVTNSGISTIMIGGKNITPGQSATLEDLNNDGIDDNSLQTCGSEASVSSINYGNLLNGQTSFPQSIIFRNTGNQNGEISLTVDTWRDKASSMLLPDSSTRFSSGTDVPFEQKTLLTENPTLLGSLIPGQEVQVYLQMEARTPGNFPGGEIIQILDATIGCP